jgi:hypothetical protein
MASTRIAALTGSPPNGAGSSKPGRRTIDVTVHLGVCLIPEARCRKLCTATLSIETAWTAARFIGTCGFVARRVGGVPQPRSFRRAGLSVSLVHLACVDFEGEGWGCVPELVDDVGR